MDKESFLVVEVPGLTTPFVAFTARHPSCTTEMVLMPTARPGEEPGLTATFLVHGLRGRDIDELRPVVEAAYPGLRMWPARGAQGAWMGQFGFRAAQLGDKTARAVIAFLEGHRLAESWVRTARGTTSFRVHLGSVPDASGLADELRRHLADAGAPGRVDIVTARPEDAWGWRALVEQVPARQA